MKEKDLEKADKTRKSWARLTPLEREIRKAAIAEAMRRKWESRSEEERKAIGEAVSKAKREKASVDKS